MTTKTRIKQLEKASKPVLPLRTVVMTDAHDEGGLAEFDSVEMTQAEADKKAAALPDGVLLLHIIYASRDIAEVSE